MYNLFLDDMRLPENAFTYTKNQLYLDLDWVTVKNYNEFVSYIKENGMPNLISFDHDLADVHYGMVDHITDDDYDITEEKTGYHCAKWLVNKCMDENLPLPKYLVHSMNNVGRRNIISLLTNYSNFLEK